MTRAREELYIFGKGLCHRLLARVPNLDEVMDITIWGEGEYPLSDSKHDRPASVAKLVKTAMIHKDLFERMVACSQHISASFHRGEPLVRDDVYEEMKKRNREIEFGTFVDWMIKRKLSATPTLQCRLLEVLYNMTAQNWFHKDIAKASHDVLDAVITDFFERAGTMPNADPMAYNMPVRFIAASKAARFKMVPELSAVYAAAEKRVISIFKKPDYELRDMYVLSHTLNLYSRGQLTAIRAIDAPENSYMGLPRDFDEFAAASVAPAAIIIKAAVRSDSGLSADVSLESRSMLYGEADLITTDGDCVVEIKCSSETTSAGLRGTAGCVNLLQLLAYVALGRHGITNLRPQRAVLVNPLTATWESYDLRTWSMEQSAEFMVCLEELRKRG
jgi:hypothetical protein